MTTTTSAWTICVDDAKPLTRGNLAMPPMVSVPIRPAASSSSSSSHCGSGAVLREIIQPPNVEELYDWYVHKRKNPDADPSWAVLWPTAVSLASYLSSNPGAVRNRRVVELGCGLGLCGLVSGALGASSVVLTDREPYAMQCALATADVNGLLRREEDDDDDGAPSSAPPRITASLLDWNRPTVPTIAGTADVVLASDVLYDVATVDNLARACLVLLCGTPESGTTPEEDVSLRNKTVLVCDPKTERAPGARAALVEALRRGCEERGHGGNFRVDVVDLPRVLPEGAEITARTMDGRDHENRMKEETVLIQCVF